MTENISGASGRELAGKRAWVTGGTRGIGAAIVRQFLEAGAKVLTTARSERSDTPSGANFVKADVRTRAGVDALARAALAELGGVDILVNNAGAARPYTEGSSSIPDGEWQDALTRQTARQPLTSQNLIRIGGRHRGLLPVCSAAGRPG